MPPRVSAVRDISGGRQVQGAVLLSTGAQRRANALSEADIRSIFRLLKIMEPAIAQQSTRLLTPSDISRVRRHADLITDPRLRPIEACSMHTPLYGGLMVPGASNIEVGALVPLLQRVTAHFATHYHRLDVRPFEFSEPDEAYHSLIDVFSAADPDAAASAIRGHLEYCEQFAIDIIAQQ